MWRRLWIASLVAGGALFIATGHIASGIAFIVLPLLAWAAGRRAAIRRKAWAEAQGGDLMTVEQAAEMLGVERDWVLTLAARDEIPYVKGSGSWWVDDLRFDRKEIEEWLQGQEIRAHNRD